MGEVVKGSTKSKRELFGYIGIDNGVSGSVAMVSGMDTIFFPTPTRKEQSYTRVKAQITRVDYFDLRLRLLNMASVAMVVGRVFIERPYVNPKGFKATASALRALESTIICLESVGLSYEYVDSRQWQRVMLPAKCKGPDLKTASRDIGIRLFPEFRDMITRHKDADSLLIAEWARRAGL